MGDRAHRRAPRCARASHERRARSRAQRVARHAHSTISGWKRQPRVQRPARVSVEAAPARAPCTGSRGTRATSTAISHSPPRRRVGVRQHGRAADDLGDPAGHHHLAPARLQAGRHDALRRSAARRKWLTPAAMKKTLSSLRDIRRSSSSEWPVIAGGFGMPISSSTVGATSASIPGPGAQPACAAGHDQRHRVHRVGGVGRAVGLEHVVGVAVVGGHDAHAVALVDGCDHLGRGSCRPFPRPPRPPRSRPCGRPCRRWRS